jgi:putative SOS response-associated peptidase YedK
MCGRFNSIASGKDFASVYDAQFLTDELLPNFNVAPTTLVYVLHRQDGGRVLDAMSWGLVPSWSKDKTRAASMINARSETLIEKPSFRNLLSKHRCVLPIQGFYEWQNLPSETKKPKKQAHYISRVDERPMTLAGLWTIWKQPDSSLLRTCTIITTEANEKLSPIHHRMPVILERDSVEIWLGESKALPNDLLVAAKNEIVKSEPTSRLDRASNSSTAQLDDDSSGRLF